MGVKEDKPSLNKKESNKKKRKIWFWIFIFILIGINYENQEKLENYKYCVEDCVSDNNDCISSLSIIEDKAGNEYLEYFEVESCADGLEYCVGDCEP